MTEHEEVLRREASKRGWHVGVSVDYVTVSSVPYRQQDGASGMCQVKVWTHEDGRTMKAPPNGGSATHTARLEGVSGGKGFVPCEWRTRWKRHLDR